MESIIDVLNMAIEAVENSGDQFDSWADRATLWSLVAYLEIKLTMLEFAYSIASGLLESLGISEYLENAWNALDGTILSVFTYLRIPEGLNAILSAAVTRFVMDLMP
ncbi:DUF2523 family protein [Marinimicrobium agarilyticum]|uniref:DUF2523 family protein n=1 Tax=Marinimicrobium agarilyticum TaxID=306546 RepID=UPI0004087A26|nr:DUF2523 family protein [Marinimicrobium agarilyticum]